jgi:hypothetical protein
MAFRLDVHLPVSSGGCYEIGACSVPWWATALMLAMLFGPTFVFAVAGWLTAHSPALMRAAAKRLVALIPLTVCFYLFAYAVGP